MSNFTSENQPLRVYNWFNFYTRKRDNFSFRSIHQFFVL